MMDDLQETTAVPLRCPLCKSDGDSDFSIAATVWVDVRGNDSLTVIDEGGDREYGSEDACRCDTCGHQARLGDFYLERQDE